MHAIAFKAVRSASGPLPRSACRTIAGARYPLSRPTQRTFRTSSAARSQPPSDETTNDHANEEIKAQEGGEASKDGKKKAAKSGSGNGRSTTVGRVRPGRQRQQNGLPPAVIPEDYWERCVLCVEEERALSTSINGADDIALKTRQILDKKVISMID